MVFQDGQAFKDENGDIRAQNVMDNLIYRREIPVMIGVFINPGRTPEQPEPNAKEWGDKTTNRPTEYNTLDDKYARVITEELMPVLYKEYNISKDPEHARHRWIEFRSNRRIYRRLGAAQPISEGVKQRGEFHQYSGWSCICGTCDWQARRNRFAYSCAMAETIIEASATVSMTRSGIGFLQNVRLMKALTQKGYDVNYSWGMNKHGQKFGGAIMPEMMRWLWRDGPVSTDPNDMVVERALPPTGR